MAFADELGVEAHMTEAEKVICRQAAALTVRSEALQAALVRGEAVDDEQLTRLTNSAMRALQALRTRRTKPKPVMPNLADYLAQRKSAAA
jgi:hypothetical protein